jgi:hypothetical protein
MWRCLHINLVAIIGCSFNLGIKDELLPKPKAPTIIETWEPKLDLMIIGGEAHKM